MRLRSLATALLSLTLASATAWADSLFTLSGDLVNGGTFSGTLSLDSSGNAFVQGTYTNGATSFTLPPNYLGEQLGEGTFTTVDVFSVNQTYDLFLIFPDPTLAGYTGGSLCAIYSSCFSLTQAYSSFQLDSFAPESNFLHLTATPATTPEPASIALLGTGLFGLATAARSRRKRGPFR